MTNSYQPTSWRWLLLVLLTLAGGGRARAQSGPYGNEWIVASQPYYKVKVWRDGLYRLNYAYLNAIGAGAVAPTRLQVWRRGKEVAVYQGGNAATLDNTTFLEFYGQRNDGALDKDYYKSSGDQANRNYSFFTDTAAYFITWGTQAGKRMAQPTATAGTPHAWRLQSVLRQHTEYYMDAPSIVGITNRFPNTYLPWLNVGEGFFGANNYLGAATSVNDSLLRAVATTATTLPRAEVVVGGATNPVAGHFVRVSVNPPSGSARVLGELTFPEYNYRAGRYTLQYSDISSAGKVEISSVAYNQPANPVFSFWHYVYTRLTVPQQVVWFGNRPSVFFQNDSLLAGVATYDVPAVPATVVGFDVHDPWNVQRIVATTGAAAGAARFVFPSATTAQTRNLLLADESQPLTPAPAQRVNFRTSISRATANFVIVTHPRLMQASGSVTNAALAYASYRHSAAGGSYDTLMVTAPLLYDQFHYGERSVLAVRHFALWLAAGSPATQAKYLLLLGKGITSGSYLNLNNEGDYPRSYTGVFSAVTTRVKGDVGLDLVPTTSRSPSDIFFSCDWPNGNYVPRFVTGRVVAATPGELTAYLDKLKDYESKLDPKQLNPEPWHKEVVNLVGGETLDEFQRFGGYLDGFATQLTHPYFGGSVTTFRRTVVGGYNINAPVINISPQVNSGLQVINYFGHGSPNYLDLNLGDVTNPISGYANAGKYPVMFFNGCAVGACFFAGRTFGSDWVLAPSKGAVGLLSEGGFSYETYLVPHQRQINSLLFNDAAWFGQPVAAVQREAIRLLQATWLASGSGYEPSEAAEQLVSTLWHGDPALRLFAPEKPDLVASSASLSITPAPGNLAVTAASAQFVLNVGVSNPARTIRDLVEIRVKRTWPGGSTTYVFDGSKALPTAFRRDTTYALTLPREATALGDNTFTVELDYNNKIAELSETNNTATLTYGFLNSGITLLTPREFAVVGTTTPRLVAQSNNLNEDKRGYDIELDSVSTFNSKGLRQSLNYQARTVVSYTPAALLAAAGRDSVVWYWRVRFSVPRTGESAAWATGSFRVIAGAPDGGWSQSHNGQFNRDALTGVAVATPSNRWSFADQPLPVRLRTAGGPRSNAATFPSVGGVILTDLASPPDMASCGIYAPNLLVAVLDPQSGARVTVPGTYSTCGSSGQTFYYFGSSSGAATDTLDNLNNSAARRTELLTFLDNVPDNSYVLLVSANRLRYTNPALAAVRTKLATLLGSALVGTLRNGEPWALVARKKASGGQLVSELGPDRTLGTASDAQTIVLDASAGLAGSAGQVLSTLIGPASQWQKLDTWIKRPAATAKYTLSLIGVDASNQEKVLLPNITTRQVDLTTAVSATTYPYLRLRLTLRDSVNHVPAQLRHWMLTYKGLPEGVVRRDLVADSNPGAYDGTLFAKQAVDVGYIKFPVKFQNVAPDAFPSVLKLQVSLYDDKGSLVKYPTGVAGAGTPVQQLVTATRSVGAGGTATDTITFTASQVQLRVIGLFGTFTPVAVVNPQLQPEQYYFNNELRLPSFTVVDTNVPPVLDVAVDGRHILNGEIVSPAPVINIQLRDEDKLRPLSKNSSETFKVYLQRAGDPAATLVTDQSLLHFTRDSTGQGSVARLEYQPGKKGALAAGMYTLQVQGTDQSNASAGALTYQVKFEVVRESSITNVLPYPNPVTSKTRFAFTVTGSELPRNMKIQILTLTGKVVREIFMNELGPLHIGSNLSDYAWDGTDQYGERLANGTYLYRVLLDDDGKFTHRATAADQAFKNDWGKLVLLR